jgi:hypothetical protein
MKVEEPSPLKLSYSFLPLFLALFTPTSREQAGSKNATPKPIETTVCKIMENPSAFNNKLVSCKPKAVQMLSGLRSGMDRLPQGWSQRSVAAEDWEEKTPRARQ